MLYTKPCRWFGAASLWCAHVGECTSINLLKFVFFSLSIPCFHASHFFFKRAYTRNQRILALSGAQGGFLSTEDLALKFDSLAMHKRNVTKLNERLNSIARGFDWDDLRGRAPDATGGLSSEAFVRELRDGWR